jgi:FixJ family two-component response regulator
MKPASSGHSRDPLVLVVDDDPLVRELIADVLASINLQSKAYASASEFFGSKVPDQATCLILDVRLPGLSGFDLQAELAQKRINIPIIFLSGYADIRMSVKAIKAGAVEFLTKPFREQDLLDAVRAALDRDRERRKINDLHRRYNALSKREQEVMNCSCRFDEQANRERNWAGRGHNKGSPAQPHEETGCKIPPRSSENGRHSWASSRERRAR